MRYIRLSLVAMSSMLPTVGFAACPCLTKTIGEKYAEAQSVFLGTMTQSVEVPDSQRRVELEFALQKSWKGTTGPKQRVLMPVSIDECGVHEQRIGASYLVFAHAESDGTLTSNMCDGTDLSSVLQSDIALLDAFHHPTKDLDDAFPDVPSTHPYAQAIREFRVMEIIAGYPDGAFRPDWSVSRAEMTKLISKSLLPYDHDRQDDTYTYTSTSLPFSDIEARAWYNLHLRRTYRAGVIKGYADGTFRPEAKVTVAEAATMVSRAMHLQHAVDGRWYEGPIRALSGRHALPQTLDHISRPITRGEVTEMLWRLSEAVVDRQSATAENILGRRCVVEDGSSVPHVDMDRVRTAWLSFYNEQRRERGLALYRLDSSLNDSASAWSNRGAGRGSLDHKRDGTSAYYDYAAIERWFGSLGLTFRNVVRTTFTENIGWGPYACSSDDCTEALIDAIHTSFRSFLAEEPATSRPHYNAIVNPHFTIMGVGVAVRGGRYFLTTHFGTELLSRPARVCGQGAREM